MLSPSRNAKLAGGKYELIEEIGRGGMGTVWRAHASILDRPCAIKFLRTDTADLATNRERFVNEARAAARLRSPYTVTIFDVDYSDGLPFIAMELLPGESLERRLARGRLSPRTTCQLVRQVATGLKHAHDTGLVHRDLKPDNIFLIEDRPLMIKILDFGVAKNIHAVSGFRTATGAIVGTPHYMSPEQAMGKPIDARCDLWSLGVVAYRCLTGRLPFDGATWPEVLLKIVHGPIPSLTSDEVDLPRAVDRWWKRVMVRDPAGRPGSALAFADSFEEAVLGASSVRSEPPNESAIRRRSDELLAMARPRRKAWWLVWIALALGLVIAGFILWPEPSDTRADEREPEPPKAPPAGAPLPSTPPAASKPPAEPDPAPAAPEPKAAPAATTADNPEATAVPKPAATVPTAAVIPSGQDVPATEVPSAPPSPVRKVVPPAPAAIKPPARREPKRPPARDTAPQPPSGFDHDLGF